MNKLVHDGRGNGYEPPPTGNANYAWILHMVSKLSGNKTMLYRKLINSVTL